MSRLTARKLSHEEISSILREKREWILAACTPEEILVFGSAASKTMTEASDVDIFVIFSSEADRDEAKRPLYGSRPTNDWPHDLILITRAEFEASAKNGGGACWLAKQEGLIIFSKGVALEPI